MKNPSDFSGKPERSLRKRSAVAYLRTIDIFQDLDMKEIEEIHRFFPMRECSSGTVFFHGGEKERYAPCP